MLLGQVAAKWYFDGYFAWFDTGNGRPDSCHDRLTGKTIFDTLLYVYFHKDSFFLSCQTSRVRHKLTNHSDCFPNMYII